MIGYDVYMILTVSDYLYGIVEKFLLGQIYH